MISVTGNVYGFQIRNTNNDNNGKVEVSYLPFEVNGCSWHPSVPPKSQSNKIENLIISGTLHEGSDMNEEAESYK